MNPPRVPAAPAVSSSAREKKAHEKVMLKSAQAQPSAPAPTISIPTPPTLAQTTYSPDYLEAHAKKLQDKANELDRVHPMGLGGSGRELLHNLTILAAALRSHAQYMRSPHSQITEYSLISSSPKSLELQALELEKLLNPLNPENLYPAHYYPDKETLRILITVLRTEVQRIRTILNTPTIIDVNFLENLAKQLQRKADDLDSVHPMNLGSSGQQTIEDYRIIAAALRSHAQQMRVPGSPITEYKLQTSTPVALEALATKLEQEKNTLDQQSSGNLSLQDHTRKKNLQAEIMALRSQAQIIRAGQK